MRAASQTHRCHFPRRCQLRLERRRCDHVFARTEKLGVEFIEQPLHSSKWEEQKRVFQESALPIIADESCLVEEDVEKCVGYFHGINIKLTKAGGLTPARRMIDLARKFNMSVMVGCMSESSVGISSISQLLPLLDYVDMDGILLIAKDVAKGVRLNKAARSCQPKMEPA